MHFMRRVAAAAEAALFVLFRAMGPGIAASVTTFGDF